MITSRVIEDVRNLRPLIQQMLDEWCRKHQTSFGLKISRRIIEQAEFTYYTVVPDREGVRSFEYVSALTEIEKFLEQEKHEENVMLLPTLPGEEDVMEWADK